MKRRISLLAGFSFAFAVGAALYVLLLPLKVSVVLFGVSFLLGVGLCFSPKLREKGFRRLVFGLALGLLWSWGYDAIQLRPLGSLDGELRRIQLIAIEDSKPTDYGCRVLCRSGKVTVLAYLDEPNRKISIGEELSLVAELRATESDHDLYNLSKDIEIVAYQKGELGIQSGKPSLQLLPAKVYGELQRRIKLLFPEDTASFALALMTGDTGELPYALRNQMSLVGISHVVAVSGMHVSLICSLVLNLCFRRRRLGVGLCLAGIWFFGAMLGFAPSVTRAVIMNSVLLLATVFRREYDSPTALGLALLVLLLGNPFAIASVGLQLSFASVAGILTFTPPICRWLRGLFQKTMKKNRFLNGLIAFFITSGATTFGASLLTLPLSALYFDTISLISVVSNLVLLPVISGIFTLGYPLVLLSWGFYPVAHLGAWLLSYPIRFSLWGVELLARMPYAALYSRSAYALLWLGASYLLLAVARKFRKPFTGILLSLGMLITVPFLQGIDRADFRFSMLDVGQGQCLLAQFHGNTFVIDCGGTQGEGAGEEAARELLSRGRSRIDGLVLTHFDMDHTGGVVQLMDRVEVGCLYLPDVTPEDSQRALILQKAEEKEIPIQWVREDIILRPDSGKVEIFAPFGTKNQNMGLCLLLSAHDCDILVTGDISIQEERQLLLMKRIPDLEILVAGHHGSRESTGYRLLDYTKPEVLLISVGANAYGHPSPEVLERGDAFHIPIRRTDQEGTITITR